LVHEVAAAGQFAGSRRVEWLTGRVLARRAVADVLGCDPSEVAIDVTDAGAPYVVGEMDVRVSISHTRDLVIAGAVRGPWLGVDVEWANRDVSRLLRALEPMERAMVEPADVVSLMVAKEAAAKSWGVGLGGSLGRWPVESIDSGVIVVGSPSGDARAVRVYDLDGAVVGVCAEGISGVSVSD
jgi:4'-phosphopantetheinyl transferase